MQQPPVECGAETHRVFNQPSPLQEINLWRSDRLLQQWTRHYGGDWHETQLVEFGQRCGGDLLAAGFLANKHKPEFHSHDRFGQRIDLVEYHPSYHQLMAHAIESGLHALPWQQPRAGAHVARAAMEYMHTQADPGSGCPLTMTFAAIAALRHQPQLLKSWGEKICSNHYDPRNVPFFDKAGLTIGMAMTEKQGGSDVRANTTRAVALGVDGEVPTFELTGHKWFCSAPMCDGFLVLAQLEEGLSCFLLPRWRPDGSKNALFIQRLKNKLGNVSNASSEVEYRGAFAWLVGEPGRGVRTIIDMVAMTRFDCMVGSSAQMAQAAREAIHHCGGREVFGKNLHQQPLMQNVLADLAIEAEAALAMTMRVAAALDCGDDAGEQAIVRLGTALGKYWICKRAVQHSYEAMESIGAVGLIDDNVAARLYREAPVNAIWEGSGNVQCLDLLRVLQREPQVLQQFFTELGSASGRDQRYDDYLAALQQSFAERETLEQRSRLIVEQMALAWQAALLLTAGDSDVAEAFVASRLAGAGGHMYGTLPAQTRCLAILQRAAPQLD